MATTVDEMVVQLRANADGLKAGMADAAASVASFSGTAEAGFRKAGDGGKSFLAAISGERAREPLRATATALGQLAGASNVAGTATGNLLRAFGALELGLTTMTGGVGLAVAAIGLLTSVMVGIITATRRANEEAEKFADTYNRAMAEGIFKVSQEADTLARRYYKVREAYAGMGAEQLEAAVRNERIHALGVEETKVHLALEHAKKTGHVATIARHEATLRMIRADITELRKSGNTVDELRAKRMAQQEEELRYRDWILQADAANEQRLSKLAEANEAAAQRAHDAWMKSTANIQAAFADMVEKGKFSLKSLEDTMKKMAADMAVKGVFSLLGSLIPGMGTASMLATALQNMGLRRGQKSTSGAGV